MSISWLQNLGSGFLVGGFEYFLCSPLPGERIQFDEHIFQRGWFNHQQVLYAFMKIPGIFGIFGWYKFCMGIPH